MKTLLKITALVAMVASLAGCKSSGKGPLLPNVSGKAGEIVVVIDKDNWEGEIGNALRGILADDCPYLAQREPLFNLANVPPGSFNNMFKMHRNILILNINPQNQTTGMMYKRDQWARPQSVAQVNAYGQEDALAIISEAKEQLPEFFEAAERDRIIANSILYEELTLRDPVEKLTGGIMHFPSGYKLRKVTDDFVWIADDKQYTNQIVLVYRYPVPENDPFVLLIKISFAALESPSRFTSLLASRTRFPSASFPPRTFISSFSSSGRKIRILKPPSGWRFVNSASPRTSAPTPTVKASSASPA